MPVPWPNAGGTKKRKLQACLPAQQHDRGPGPWLGTVHWPLVQKGRLAPCTRLGPPVTHTPWNHTTQSAQQVKGTEHNLLQEVRPCCPPRGQKEATQELGADISRMAALNTHSSRALATGASTCVRTVQVRSACGQYSARTTPGCMQGHIIARLKSQCGCL